MARLGLRSVAIDRLLAGVLTLGLELELWLGGESQHRAWLAALGPLVTLPVAFRRSRPTEVALLVIVVDGIVSGLWGAPSVVSWLVAWICALYGLAVWSGPRGFALAASAIALVDGLAIAGPGTSADEGVTFGLATLVVLLVVRRVLGEREERIRLAERERDLAAREAVVAERARIAASCTTWLPTTSR